MNKIKPMITLLLSLLAVVMLLTTTVFAAGSIDLYHDVSLTISYQGDKTPLDGAKFDIYLVATVDECGELTPTDTFSQFNVKIRGKNDEAWKTLASTLEGYVLRDKIIATDSGKTNNKGLVSFPNNPNSLTPGLYLVLGHRHSQGGWRYDATPFMVMLPGLDEEANDWVYEVTANAKHKSKQIPNEPDESEDEITRKVLKRWKDDDYEEERPKEVIIQLLRDGEIYDTVALNAQNDWRHSWTALDDSYSWTVVEKELEDYTAEVTQEGITFVVTNTYTEDIPDEPIPTGPTTPDDSEAPDNSTTPDEPATPDEPILPLTGQLWWPVPVLLAAGLLFIVIGLIRRRGVADEE